MAIDVIYEGVVLHKGTKMMATPTGTFVELEHPMPVGTRLQLEENGVAVPVRVERVHEGPSPGVFVAPVLDAAPAPVVTDEMPPADTEPVMALDGPTLDESKPAAAGPAEVATDDARKTKRPAGAAPSKKKRR